MKIVTGQFCGACKAVKSILDKKGVKYDEIMFDSEEGKEIIEKSGQNKIPIIVDNDNLYIGSNAMRYVNSL